MMDLLDNILGPLNYWDRIIGWTQIQFRRGSKRRRQRHGRTETVRVKIPYCDRTAGVASPITIERHMKKHGITLYARTHDANHFYASVPKNQYAWFLKLYNGGALWSPKITWRDKQR